MIRAERISGYGSCQVDSSFEDFSVMFSSRIEEAAISVCTGRFSTTRMRLYVPRTSCRPIKTVHQITASDEITSRPPPKRQECRKQA